MLKSLRVQQFSSSSALLTVEGVTTVIQGGDAAGQDTLKPEEVAEYSGVHVEWSTDLKRICGATST